MKKTLSVIIAILFIAAAFTFDRPFLIAAPRFRIVPDRIQYALIPLRKR